MHASDSTPAPVGVQQFHDVMVPNYAPADFVPLKGAGARVWTAEGDELVDFGGGIAVNSLGHCHPALVEALTEQARKLWHVSNIVTNAPALHLARTLCEVTFAERVFFCNSGAEANEAALKLARRRASLKHGAEKRTILSFRNSFHGRTLFTVSVGGQPKYTEHFGPLPEGIEHLPYNDCAALEAAVNDDTCAIIAEPIQGEGGVIPGNVEFLKALRAACDRVDATLIFDEVQSGVGRTGSLYGYMQADVVPDVLTTAKGLGGGFPIGAMLTKREWAEYLPAGTHGTTFGGNPLGCAVAQRVIELVNVPAFLQTVEARGEALRQALSRIGEQYGVFREVRGLGLLLGGVVSEAWAGRAGDIVKAGHAEGVWCLVAGPDVVRFAPPLNLSEQEMGDGLARLERAIQGLVPA
ncbi:MULTISPECIES: acetylornithine/succinyldiaminopimelate transaminase [Pseudomonadota]|uniref:acetylornithine/succinyldiaminopimelate transaminase n=1 Tax=Pseudomonadota TaxID=1224 RepID=UPI001CA6D7C4|nr:MULTISPECIES: acetylornithine/succinyldiaminopimelate transaminase [Pseudomonadota]MBY8965983.1 acetylornithine/succinyldiaminopimelate transaminase [Algiphilus acroporae]MCI5069139.1 acetylornithine/succinyldiaminopimelate transaminase [Acidovorax sp.]MCI5103742.1 acetylornithine/succinyldiaminopimelate transaminase [Algiphilus sp.]